LFSQYKFYEQGRGKVGSNLFKLIIKNFKWEGKKYGVSVDSFVFKSIVCGINFYRELLPMILFS